MLLGSAALVTTAAFGSLQRAVAFTIPASVQPDPEFMALSRLLVNHNLRADVGARMAAHARKKFPGYTQSVANILALAQQREAVIVEDFFDGIPEGEARDLAYWMIAAWYSGMSGATNDAEMFAYEHALTFQVTRDVVPIPSYGFTGPNRWDLDNVPLAPIPHF